MKESNRTSIIKLYVGNGLKAKIKATASLNNMTFTELFIDALFAKHPHLSLCTEKSKEVLQNYLADVLKQLSNSADMPEDKRNELKERKNLLKKQIRQKGKHEQKQREETAIIDIEDFIMDIISHSNQSSHTVIPLGEKADLNPNNL